MAIKSINKSPSGEKTRTSLSTDNVIQYEETQTWYIVLDDSAPEDWRNWTTTSALLGADPNGNQVPTIGSSHPQLPTLMRVHDVDCARSDKSPFLFIATVEYGPMPDVKPAETGGGTSAVDKWNITVRTAGLQRSEDLHNDLVSSLPIVNSAGQAFDPPVKSDRYDEEINVEFRTKDIDFTLVNALRGKINTSPVSLTIRGKERTFPTHTLRLGRFDYSTQVGDGIQFYQVSITLHYRSQLDADGHEVGHIRQVVDRGFYEFNESWADGDPQGKMFVPIVDAHQNPITVPAFLDGAGRQLQPDSSGDLPKCKLLTYSVDYVADLNPLLATI